MSKPNWFTKLNFPKWLLGLLVLVFFLRIPSFFEPYYYGDEMIYLTLGQGIRQGLTLYKEIHDNKPPLLYLLAAVSENIFIFKAILCFWNLATITIFYKLAKLLFAKNDSLQKIATCIFAVLTTIPLFEGNIVNSELFMILFTITSFLILLQKELTSKKIFIAGFLFGLAALFKIPAAFDLPVIIFYWFIISRFQEFPNFIKKSIFLILGFITPIFITFGWYYLQGALPEYIKAAFLQNVGYLSSFRPGDVQKPFYIKNAPLLIRGGIVLLGISVLYFKRKLLSKNFIFLSIWILLGLFAVTLSERPYPHYFVQVIPAVSLFLGILFAEKSLEQSLVIIPLTLSLFIPFYYRFYYYQTATYYKNFIYFALGKESKEEYLQKFSNNIQRNYQIADFLVQSSRKSDKVFIWDSDSAVIYALSRRLPPLKYVADYHINDFTNKKDVARTLSINPPKFILLNASHDFPDLELLVKTNYLLVHQIKNINIYSKLGFGN